MTGDAIAGMESLAKALESMGNAKTEYTIVWDTAISSMIRQVNENIKAGYDPVGGIAVTDNVYYQAMTRTTFGEK